MRIAAAGLGLGILVVVAARSPHPGGLLAVAVAVVVLEVGLGLRPGARKGRRPRGWTVVGLTLALSVLLSLAIVFDAPGTAGLSSAWVAAAEGVLVGTGAALLAYGFFDPRWIRGAGDVGASQGSQGTGVPHERV